MLERLRYATASSPSPSSLRILSNTPPQFTQSKTSASSRLPKPGADSVIGNTEQIEVARWTQPGTARASSWMAR